MDANYARETTVQNLNILAPYIANYGLVANYVVDYGEDGDYNIAIIMLSGMAFGPEAGFLVGAVSAFASNFFYGQGAYTPWQMFAYGAGGMLAGFLFAKGRIPQKRWIMDDLSPCPGI